jgi:hypothetical protein
MLFRGRKLPVKEEPKKSTTRRQSQPSIPTAINLPVVPQEPEIQNAAMFLDPINNPPPVITTPQELRNVLSPMSSVGIDNINPEPEDPGSGKFLASLIAQGAAGFGAGIMGGSSQDILRSTGMFDRMRESDINRQDRLRQNELLRAERSGERQEKQAEIKKREDQAKLLTDPNSQESKNRRQVYKSLGLDVPENLSYTDLNDPVVLQSMRDKLQEKKLASMPRGGIGVGGVGKPKEEKESKDQKETDKFTSNTETIKKQLEEYRKAIKAIKSPLGYAAEKAKAEGLANSLLLKIKTAEKTGALDAGSIQIIQEITGSPDYTRDDVIDARVNQALRNLNDNVENELRGTGTVNKFYRPYIPPEISDDREKAIIQNYYNNPNDPDNLQMYQDLRNKKGF